MEQLLELVKPLLELYGAGVPLVVKIVSTVGLLRLVVKPSQAVFEALKELAKATPSPKDDQILEEVEQSKALQYAKVLVNWLLSVKLK
jgi:hypothetical protein